MTRSLWRILLALPLFATMAMAAEPEPVAFAKAPTGTKAGDSTTITFAVDRATDVAVYILNKDGKVVRHLVAGVLGKRPPAPLKPGLEQSIEWDGKNDEGKEATGAPFKVRVAAGLTPTFDQFLMYNPDALPRLEAIAAAPGGELYLFHSDSVSNGNQGGLKIRVWDREGRYKRMLMPFPADLPHERVKALDAFQDEEKRLVPRLQNFQTLSLLPDVTYVRGRTLHTTSPAADSKGTVHWLIRGGRIASLDSRGGCPYKTFFGPRLFPDDNDLQANARYGHEAACLAVGEGDKYLYVSGLHREGKELKRALPCVYRVDIASRSNPKLFAGDPGTPGAEGRLLTRPRGVACSDGVVYVADAGANRVVALSEKDGRVVGEIKVTAPNFVGVDPRNGALYVVSGAEAVTPTLTKFDGIKTGKKICSVVLPRSSHTKIMNHSMAVDTSQKAVRIWVAVKAFKRYRVCVVEDQGTKLTVDDGFLARMSKWQRIPQDLSVDRKRGELYVRGYRRIDEETGKVSEQFTFGRKVKGQVVVCPDGSLVTMSNRTGLERWTRDGKPLAWEGAPDNKPERTGITEVVMTLGPVGNLAVRGDEIYALNFGSSETRSKNLEVHGMDGKLKRVAVYGCVARTNPRVDVKGNIYVASPVKPRGRFCPPFFDDKFEAQEELRSYRNSYNYMYGSIIKFPPSGGAMYYTGAKKGALDAKYVPEAIRKKPTMKISYPSHACGRISDGTVQGAEWIRPGFAPFSMKHGGTAFCHCENSGFDVDDFGRVFYPNLGQFRVEVVDTDNNWIGSFGHYGNQDSGGPDATVKTPEIPLAWPAYVAVSDKYAYVSDSINLRIVRVKLEYEAEATVAVK